MSAQARTTRGRFNLSAWTLRHRSFVIFMMLSALIAGALSYMRLSRNEDPPFTIKTMVVAADWPGATTADTVRLLTEPLEKRLAEIKYLDYTQSYTRPGKSVIFVNLKDDAPPAEIAEIWYQVRKKVENLAPMLPQGVQGPWLDDEFGDTYGSIFAFTADGFTLRDLRDRVDVIRNQLLSVPDIGKVNLLGVQEEEIVIEFSTARLAAFGLDQATVIEALRAQNAVAPAGELKTDEDKILFQVSGAFASEESLRELVLRIDGRFVRLVDIADVRRGLVDTPAPSLRVNGETAIGLAISMTEGGNLIEFGARLRARMAQIEASLPPGIAVVQVADQSTVVEDAIGGFVKVLLEAIGIVLAVSFLSLGLRAGLVITAAIPLVLAMTFIGMEIAGIGLQRISLGALIIALGLLVDDAMITVESMVGQLEIGRPKDVAAGHAYETTAFPMLTGTLVMIAGFIPVGFAASSAGEYTYSLFMVVLISLSASWIVAVLFAPLLGMWLLPDTMKHEQHGEGRFMRAFRRVLEVAMRWRIATLALFLAAFAAAVFGATKLEEQFFPASDRPELLVNLNLPQNASRQATEARARALEEMLSRDPGVRNFTTYVGSGSVRFYLPMDLLLDNDNVSQTVIVAGGVQERDEVQQRLEAFFANQHPDIVTRVSPLEVGPPVGWPIRFRVLGPDYDVVKRLGAEVAGIVAGDNRTSDINLTAGEPQRRVRVELNQVEARALGISSQSVANEIAATIAGTSVTSVRDGNRMVDVVIRGRPHDRSTVSAIEDLHFRAVSGASIPLRQIATVAYGMDEPVIWRRSGNAMVIVQADVAKNVQPATVALDIDRRLEPVRAQLPIGYAIEISGVVEEAAKGTNSILAVLPAMAFVIFALLMVQLQSFARTGLAILMAPFGLIGVVAAMLPTGTPMGFVAQLGVIALAGMIIRNAVILIQEVDENVRRGEEPWEAIVHASTHRARPIVLTALAAMLGMVPIAFQIFWGPMAFAIIGGLAVATIATLLLLPCLLLWLLQYEQRGGAAEGRVETAAAS
ncbi:multidrug efflux pump subunit AcrB [Pseudochelatococcus lubricantis]|uniref:Multidrug efflux pump subunit AcrB n=1 Tax=Pseudochelatococcus lubricantis TaxID=1538102 RepID=A0ABX0V6I8_9HYPH|nr:efflux RND transporter permease subunit [Pseudochelatococcus lubricantis]NIJ58746.1 multidrug efflux pump subunit AcrB [Pseudochelatococcus lubricantis]